MKKILIVFVAAIAFAFPQFSTAEEKGPPLALTGQDFDGDARPDTYRKSQDRNNSMISVTLAKTPQFTYTSRLPHDYDVSEANGFWLTGDIDGNGCADVIHLWKLGKYAHVHLSKCGDNPILKYPTAPFVFAKFGDQRPGHEYDMTLGSWTLSACRWPNDPRAVLQHSYIASDGSNIVHFWIPTEPGKFRLNGECNAK